MKTIIALLGLCITAAILSACGSKEVKPNDPVPVNCYEHQTLVDGKCVDKPPVCAENQELKDGVCVTKQPPKPELPEYCKYDETKKFVCGAPPKTKSFGMKNAVWLGLPACGPDTDGDNVGEGAAFFRTLAEIEAVSKQTGATIRVTMKDKSVVQYGIGFAAPCQEL